MRVPQVYMVTTEPEGVTEGDGFVCGHCQKIVHVPPYADPAALGGQCKSCDRLICPRCVGGGCRPIEKWLDEVERRIESDRTYAHMMAHK